MLRLLRKLAFPVADILSANLAMLGALLLRFEGDIPQQYLAAYYNHALMLTALMFIIFVFFGLYKNLWQYASIYEAANIVAAVTIFSIGTYLLYLLVPESLPRSIFVLQWGIMLGFIGGSRLTWRFYASWRYNVKGVYRNNILIIGAGQAGSMVIKELFSHPHLGRPMAILDENPDKRKYRIHGVPVVGSMAILDDVVASYNIQEIIVAIPSASETDIRRILNQCKATGCKLRRLPGIYAILDGNISITQIRDVEITDLLGRPEVQLDMDSICSYIQEKVVLVTGAGGSIGSELCRQIAGFNPQQLVMVDNYENNLYMLQRELMQNPNLNLTALIGSVQDQKRMENIFSHYTPQVVFHAAAHKHVPLMEDSPAEAVKNNIFGTINVAKAADRYNADKFILISTDKAVNPTNVMGASKRTAEIAIQQINRNSSTEFASVRFGNVLGSNGSVIPIFQRQIKRGGPVTVTHPEVTRYFMTIPEAVQLVIQAGALAQGGEVFILDMGEPVKIVELARDLISLSGFKPDEDIEVKYTGLRPGEKMYEELLLDVETADKTSNEKIFICRASSQVSREELMFLQKMLREPKDAAFYAIFHEVAAATEVKEDHGER